MLLNYDEEYKYFKNINKKFEKENIGNITYSQWKNEKTKMLKEIISDCDNALMIYNIRELLRIWKG